ncbi:response regulator transcription factor [Aequorivita capsosiphonis]|uniref:response regulator transcription factor n=1 Tax=Aequorivita capsosiphonis TaxID=487317 RepID=UPI0003FDE0C5|nr:response regulator transcription factor [Aequorivita capsosiphonis]
MKILIVEDDHTLSLNISDALNADGFFPEVVYDGLLAERMLKKKRYNCIVMDVNLPGRNGFDLCKLFREYDSVTPVIMLTAFAELEDKVQGYDCGADDYLTKPFFMRELIMRIKSLIKRSQNASKESLKIKITTGDIVLKKDQKKVLRQGKEIKLTPREYQILLKLMEHSGEIVSKADLIESIWGGSFQANTNTIEVYMNFLRNKIDKPFGKNTIKTKIGYGYYLDVNEN